MNTKRDAQIYFLRRLISSHRTPFKGDRIALAIILNGAKAVGLYREAQAIAMELRADWLAYLTKTQREWQAHSHRPSRCRGGHQPMDADALAARHKYVTCEPQ